MTQDEPAPKLHVDTDWKAEAQAEKERLAAEETARQDSPGPSGADGSRAVPEASFQTLIGVLASQALMGLGTMQDPDTKGIVIDLEGSRFSIDLLSVIEEKTKGNLTDEESRELTTILTELRARYVQVSQLVAQQASAAGAAGPLVEPGPS